MYAAESTPSTALWMDAGEVGGPVRKLYVHVDGAVGRRVRSRASVITYVGSREGEEKRERQQKQDQGKERSVQQEGQGEALPLHTRTSLLFGLTTTMRGISRLSLMVDVLNPVAHRSGLPFIESPQTGGHAVLDRREST